MKKLITGILATLACFAFAVGCGETNNNQNSNDSTTSSTQSQATDVNAAAEFLEAKYLEEDTEGRYDYELVNTVKYPALDGYTYNVSWSVDITDETIIKLVVDGNVTKVIVNKSLDEDKAYVLTATVSDSANHKATFTLNRTLLKAPPVVPEAITEAPKADEVYKLYMYQTVSNTERYFNGKVGASYYLAAEEDHTTAVDITVKAVDGKEGSFYLTFNDIDDDSVQYIGVKNNFSNGKWRYNVFFAANTTTPSDCNAASFEWTWNAEYSIMTTTIVGSKDGSDENVTKTEDAVCYLGTYSTNWTIGASKWSHITGDDTSLAKLVKLVDKDSITADKKVAAEKVKMPATVETTITGEDTVTLPAVGASYGDVAISWAIKEGVATLENNVLTLAAPTAETTVVLTATLTCGEVTDTVDVTITHKPVVTVETPAADSELTIEKANAFGDTFESNAYSTDKYYVVGKVKQVKSTTWGNMVLEDEKGNTFEIYGMYAKDTTDEQISNKDYSTRFDTFETKPVVGDTVKVYGIIGKYNTTVQMKNAWLITLTPGTGTTDPAPEVETPAADSELTIEKANAFGSTFESNAYSSAKYYVVGKVKEVKSTTWGNMVLEDEKGNTFEIYGMYAKDTTDEQISNKDYSTRFDTFETKPVVGDTVKVYGIIGKYNTTVQMKNAWLITLTPGTGTTDPAPETPVDGLQAGFKSSEFTVADTTEFSSLTADDITFTVDSTGCKDVAKYYNAGLRIYTGNIFTISCADGYKITSVSFKTSGSKNLTTTTTIENATAEINGTSVVLTPAENATSIVLTAGAQFRIAEIVVTYEKV